MTEAMDLMKIEPGWFTDERISSFIQTYQFFLPHPSQAFKGPISEQPAIWIEAKLIIDNVYEQHKRAENPWLT